MIYYVSERKSSFNNQVNAQEGKRLVAELFDESRKRYGKYMGLDTETNGLDILENDILLYILGLPETQIVIDACTVDYMSLMPDDYQKYRYIGHNIKFDAGMIAAEHGIMFDKLYCTAVVDRKLYQNAGFEFDLWAVRKRHLGISNTVTDEQKSFIGKRRATFIPSISQIVYAADDTQHLIPIKDSQLALVKEYELGSFIKNVELELINVLIKMELQGILVREDKWIENTKEVERQLYEVQCELDEYMWYLRDNYMPAKNRKLVVGGKYTAKRQFKPINISNNLFSDSRFGKYAASKGNINWNSTLQVADVLARLQLPMTTADGRGLIPILSEVNKLQKGVGDNDDGDTNTHGGWSTKASVIEKYVIDHPDNPESKLFLLLSKHAKLLKALTTYGYVFLEHRSKKTGRIHTVYRQCDTANARLSSGGGDKLPNKPNLQNLPRDNKLRHCVIPRPGYKIQTTDYTGAEVVIICDKANDQKLYELAVIKDDAHSPIITNSWKHIFLYRACKLAQVVNGPAEYFENWQTYAKRGFNHIDKTDGVMRNYQLYLEFEVNKQTNKEYRQGGKNCTFGSIYNMGADTAAATYNGTTTELRKKDPNAQAVNVTKEDAEVALWAIKQFIPTTFEYTDYISALAFGQGYLVLNERSKSRVWFKPVVEVLAACRMTIDELAEIGIESKVKNVWNGHYTLSTKERFSIKWDIVHEIDGQARNLPISGTQADMIKEAMVVLDKLATKYNIPINLLMQVHDELVHEVPEDFGEGHTIPAFKDDVYGITWDGTLPDEKFVPYVMSDIANRYLVNVRMSATSEIKDYWTK